MERIEKKSANTLIKLRLKQADLNPHFNTIFLVLHLLYEEIKLNKLIEPVENPKLARLLLKLILCCDPIKKSSFLNYYFSENPNLEKEFD